MDFSETGWDEKNRLAAWLQLRSAPPILLVHRRLLFAGLGYSNWVAIQLVGLLRYSNGLINGANLRGSNNTPVRKDSLIPQEHNNLRYRGLLTGTLLHRKIH